MDGPAGDRLEGQWLHERPRPGGENDADVAARLAQAPYQVGGLIGRDPAGDPEQDAAAGELRHGVIRANGHRLPACPGYGKHPPVPCGPAG
ncbi:hypothetical protein KBTX_03442 [wastewater metagenome]|uniref:Uncharacterized protein n=2 Tax=unclassified sequences TaxID=12908 RepID=A0A5B8RJN8_9ZZZZ|nr:hypothetical protein KBTEX_03442 [uncultured organism]